MRNERCVAETDLVRICQIYLDSDTTIQNLITMLVQYCQKRKTDFNEIKQKDTAV